MSTRNRRLDVAKGICMVCMIVVHTFNWWDNAYPLFNYFTGTWFLVFFFFASGIYYKVSDRRSYIKKRVKRIYLPYLLYCVIYTAFLWLVQKRFGAESWLEGAYTSAVNVIEALPVGIENVDFFGVDTIGVGPAWFLNCMFFTNLLYLLLYKNKYRLLIWFLATIAATISQRYFLLPFTLQNAVIGCMFVALGDCTRAWYKKYIDFLENGKGYQIGLVCTCVVGMYLYLMCTRYDQWMNLGGNHYRMQSLPSSILGFVLVITVAFYIEKMGIWGKLFECYGKNSLTILIMHSADILMIRNWYNRGWGFLVITLLGYPCIAYIINWLKGLVFARKAQ